MSIFTLTVQAPLALIVLMARHCCEDYTLYSAVRALFVHVRVWGWVVLKNGWLLNPRSFSIESLEHWSIWVSPLKTREMGYEIEVVHRARGINRAYWAVILRIKQVLQRMADRHFRIFCLVVAIFPCSITEWHIYKEHMAALCVYACECFWFESTVCLSIHAWSNCKH